MVITVRGHEEIFFDFGDSEVRDTCVVAVLGKLEAIHPGRHLAESAFYSEEDMQAAEIAKAEHKALQEARRADRLEHDVELPSDLDYVSTDELKPVLFDDPRASILNFKPTESLRITCLTIGSRGDVQPYIALCKGLLKEGHKPRIATHVEFKSWIEKHGIEFAPVEGDPAILMQLCVENGMFTYSFMKEASLHVSMVNQCRTEQQLTWAVPSMVGWSHGLGVEELSRQRHYCRESKRHGG